jgi:hypothetical protein
LLSV